MPSLNEKGFPIRNDFAKPGVSRKMKNPAWSFRPGRIISVILKSCTDRLSAFSYQLTASY